MARRRVWALAVRLSRAAAAIASALVLASNREGQGAWRVVIEELGAAGRWVSMALSPGLLSCLDVCPAAQRLV
ncbi:hypothetical protein D3C72_1799610 [compost metagenome]